MPGVLVIIPTYNERENITKLVPQVWTCLSSDERSNHILVVDDNSPDGTAEAVLDLAQHIKNLHIISRPGKLGLGSAYLDGYRWGLSNVRPDVFIQMDADFSHSPCYLASLIQSIHEGFGVAVASRYVEGGGSVNWPWHRKMISRGANILAQLLLGIKVRDVTSGFRAFSRNAVENLLKVRARSDDYSYLLESLHLLSKQGLRVKEIPFIYQNRRLGKTKLSTFETLRYGFILLRLATSMGT